MRRHLPLFHLCRPLVELSKKELALFRLFENLSALPTQPFLLHSDQLFISSVPTVRNQNPSVRWLLQDFLIEMQKDNSATVHNLLSASRKLDPAFVQWGDNDIRRLRTNKEGLHLNECFPSVPLVPRSSPNSMLFV